MNGPAKVYPVTGPGRELDPDYGRVVRALDDAELEDEILGRRGDEGYQAALVAEHDRRSRAGAPPEPATLGRVREDADDWDDAA